MVKKSRTEMLHSCTIDATWRIFHQRNSGADGEICAFSGRAPVNSTLYCSQGRVRTLLVSDFMRANASRPSNLAKVTVNIKTSEQKNLFACFGADGEI